MPDNATPLIVITRPQAQATRFAGQLREKIGAGAEIVVAPLMQIDFVGHLPDTIGALIFTSENGVRAYGSMGGPAGPVAYCVGNRTAKAAQAAGLNAISAAGTVEDLKRVILDDRPAVPLLHIHGKNVSGTLAEDLNAAGLSVTAMEAYCQTPLRMSEEIRKVVAGPRQVIAPLFSPVTAQIFAQQLQPIPMVQNLNLPCISANTAAALPPNLHELASISAHPDAEGLMNLVARQLCT